MNPLQSMPAMSPLQSEIMAAPDRAEMPVKQLVALTRSINTMIDLASALGSKHGMTDAPGVLNAAGSEFDAITDMLVNRYLDALDRLRDAEPRDPAEREERGCELLRHDLECCQDATDTALAAVRRRFPGRY